MTTPPAGPGQQAVYTGRVTNWPLVAFSLALFTPLLIFGGSSEEGWHDVAIPLTLGAVVVLTNALTASNVRTTVGPNGVAVRLGVLGWPRGTYGLEQIARAEVINLLPWYVVFGFWWTRRGTHYTVRSGPTLRLTLHSGRTITVTVPEAETALAVLREAAPRDGALRSS